ncbi:MAG: hypothetical protein QNJ01_09135, partial [Desulfobacterales bacterium]|nr:hypothetical protein [Desulfobacterales bacterium]
FQKAAGAAQGLQYRCRRHASARAHVFEDISWSTSPPAQLTKTIARMVSCISIMVLFGAAGSGG